MRALLVPALVAVLALPSAAGFTPALDYLQGAVAERVTTIDGSTRKGRKLVKTLRAAGDRGVPAIADGGVLEGRARMRRDARSRADRPRK